MALSLSCWSTTAPRTPSGIQAKSLRAHQEKETATSTVRQGALGPKVHIYYMRHGQSINNAVSVQPRGEDISRLAQARRLVTRAQAAMRRDVPLSILGRQACAALCRCIHAGELLHWPSKVHLIVASPLLRALQTAGHTFPSAIIYPLPYLKERLRYGTEFNPPENNLTSGPDTQNRRMTLSVYKRIDYRYVLDGSVPEKFSAAANAPPDYTQYINRLAEVLPELVDLDNAIVNIVVVGHASALQQFLLSSGIGSRADKPWNQSIVRITYTYDRKLKRLQAQEDLQSWHNPEANPPGAQLIFEGFEAQDGQLNWGWPLTDKAPVVAQAA